MTTSKFDVIVIGAGPAGYVAAVRLSQLGFKVAVVEKNKSLGGTCLNVGCIPSKSLLDSSHKYFEVLNHFETLGIESKEVSLNLNKMMNQKEKVIQDLTKGIEHLFKKNKITHIHGIASFKDAQTLEVVSSLSSEKSTLSAPKIIIATGSVPQTLEALEVDEKEVVTSTGALSFEAVPRHLVIIGGGYIGLELGSVWSRLGSKVTVIEYSDDILMQMDEDVRGALKSSLVKMGMVFKLGYGVVGLNRHQKPLPTNGLSQEDTSGHLCVHMLPKTADKESAPELITCDAVLVSTGRKPFIDSLNLEGVGIHTEKNGAIKVNQYFETSVKGVFAIGDCIQGPMLAHKAMDEGVALAEQLSGQAGFVNYNIIPAVVFTHPEIATVGKTEASLKQSNISYKVGKFPYSANGRARVIGETTGFVKILMDVTTDKVIGAAIVGADAGALIGQIAAIMEFGGTAEDIARTCHAHPTLNEVVKEAAWAAFNKPIHS